MTDEELRAMTSEAIASAIAAEVLRLRAKVDAAEGLIAAYREATDREAVWCAMDGAHDMDVSYDEYADAVAKQIAEETAAALAAWEATK